MATKWLAFLVFLIQVEHLSCCVFDKVNVVKMSNALDRLDLDKNECLAACYANEECSAVMHNKEGNKCYLFNKGENLLECAPDVRDCYVLQRDEVDPVCKTFVNF